MAEPPHPEQLPVIPDPGEWNFIGTTTAPPASGQIRMDNATQTAATKLWFNKLGATGSDHSAYLAIVKKGQEITLTNKSDSTKWQTYTVSANPIDNTGYVEYPVVWARGNAAIPSQRTTMTVVDVSVSVSVNVTAPPPMQASVGNVTVLSTQNTNVTVAVTAPPPMQASVGSVTVLAKQSVVVPVTAPPPMQGFVGRVDISGQLVTRDFAFPFQGQNYTSPGMTLRQWYASQAMSGFIASAPAANLIGGNLAAFCFKVADSMIKHEQREAKGARQLTVSVNAPPNAAPPTQSAPSSVSMKEALALQKHEAARAPNGKGT